jgi:hypothetical protein
MDKKHAKKVKRDKKKKKDRKQVAEQYRKLSKQVSLFSKLGDHCSACNKTFPKTRDAHATWRVAVQSEKQKVWLFCPDCQTKAKDMAENKNEV